MNDAAPDLLAHRVTADFGSIHATDMDDPIRCVRLLFHHGGGDTPVHSEKFFDPDGLPALIGELRDLQSRTGVDLEHRLRMALLPWVQEHFIQRYEDKTVVSHNEAVEELLAIVRASGVATEN